VVKSVAKYVAKCVVESLLLNQLLDTSEDEDVFLAEESWQDLLELPVTRQILQEDLDADACIEIKDLGFALHLSQPAELWLLLTDHYSSSKILSKHAERWHTKIIKTVQASEADFFSALTEYLSTSLAAELFCERCLEKGSPHYVEERIDRLVTLLQPILSEDESMLEICCGSGMATQALIRNGCRPLSMDYDRCDLCMGLKSGLMDPKRCFLLDARLLPQIFPDGSFHTVLGFMVGLIDDFNWPLWREILLAASRLAKNKVLFTVYTQKEAELIAKALGDIGWQGKVIDNRDSKGIYDQWACVAVKQQ
jgi:hypothetical protein